MRILSDTAVTKTDIEEVKTNFDWEINNLKAMVVISFIGNFLLTCVVVTLSHH